jgi:hypothetical protein
LDNPVFAPVLQSFARVSLLAHDVYEHLLDQKLTNEDGELRLAAIDSVRKLMVEQSHLAERLGLTPATLQALAISSAAKPVLDLNAFRSAADGGAAATETTEQALESEKPD